MGSSYWVGVLSQSEKWVSRGVADKFIWNEFEQLSETKLPRRGEVQGCTL
jgi:hypothetical protein